LSLKTTDRNILRIIRITSNQPSLTSDTVIEVLPLMVPQYGQLFAIDKLDLCCSQKNYFSQVARQCNVGHHQSGNTNNADPFLNNLVLKPITSY
jgi:hypothetical protein